MSTAPDHPFEPEHAQLPSLELLSSFYHDPGNKSDAPAHLLLMAGVRGLAYVFNLPVESELTGRPKPRIWMPMFVRHMTRSDDAGKTWLRFARIALQREMASPETLAAVERLEEQGFDRPLMFAFANILESA